MIRSNVSEILGGIVSVFSITEIEVPEPYENKAPLALMCFVTKKISGTAVCFEVALQRPSLSFSSDPVVCVDYACFWQL